MQSKFGPDGLTDDFANGEGRSSFYGAFDTCVAAKTAGGVFFGVSLLALTTFPIFFFQFQRVKIFNRC
jgi:hypothetical protein